MLCLVWLALRALVSLSTMVSFACERGNHVACDGCDCGCHEHPSRGGGR